MNNWSESEQVRFVIPRLESSFNLCLETMQQVATESFLQEKPPRYVPPDPQVQAGRLQKQTDFLR